MKDAFYHQLSDQLEEVKAEGLFKKERVIVSPQIL